MLFDITQANMNTHPMRTLLMAGCTLTLLTTAGCAEENDVNVDMADTTTVTEVQPVVVDTVTVATGDSVDFDGDGDFDEIRGAADEAADAVEDAAEAGSDAVRGAADAVEDVVTGD